MITQKFTPEISVIDQGVIEDSKNYPDEKTRIYDFSYCTLWKNAT